MDGLELLQNIVEAWKLMKPEEKVRLVGFGEGLVFMTTKRESEKEA